MKLNTPNKITLSRIVLLPLIVFFYLADFLPFNKLISAIVFILASSTDFIDGYVARKQNKITTLGKFLDPIADKLIVISALVLIVADNVIVMPYNVIIAIIIIGRELIVSAFRQVAASKGVVMQADKWGKIKTVFQSIAIPSLMIYAELQNTSISTNIITAIKIFSYATVIIATVLSVISGVNYLVKNKEVLKQD